MNPTKKRSRVWLLLWAVLLFLFANAGGDAQLSGSELTSKRLALDFVAAGLSAQSAEGCDNVDFDMSGRWDSLTARKVNSAAVDDFNHDGKPDLAAVTSADSAAVWLGEGNGKFHHPVMLDLDFNGFSQADEIVSGDFNGDGNPDVAAIYHNGTVLHGVVVWLGDGAGRFSAFRRFGLPDTFSIASADFNRDGKLDVVAGITDTYTGLAVLLGDEVSIFRPWHLIEMTFPHLLATTDFNGDGKPDLATAQFDVVSVRLGDGAGGFSIATSFRVSSRLLSMVVGDFNRDEWPDLAYAYRRLGSDIVEVLWGDGKGGGNVTAIGVGFPPSTMEAADFNRDGRLDLAAARAGTETIDILLGDGMGGFHSGGLLVVGAEPAVLAAHDFNGDGSPDLAVANRFVDSLFGRVNVLPNTCRANPPPVSRNATITRVASLPNPTTAGQTVFFRIYVKAKTASGMPAGQVRLWKSGVALSPWLTLTAGKAEFHTKQLGSSIHRITARYSGDAAHLPSSGIVFQFVN